MNLNYPCPTCRANILQENLRSGYVVVHHLGQMKEAHGNYHDITNQLRDWFKLLHQKPSD